MSIKCVLFDFDGVIADTESKNIEYCSKAFRHFGINLTAQEKASLIGSHDSNIIKLLLDRAPRSVSLEEYQQVRAISGNSYEDEQVIPEPGFVRLAVFLHSLGIKIGIVSSTRSALILKALNRMKIVSLFDLILCGDMTQKHKPDPEPYEEAIKILGFSPYECLIFDDSKLGIRAAVLSGAKTIAYTGATKGQDISEAEYQLASFDDFYKLAKQQPEWQIYSNNNL